MTSILDSKLEPILATPLAGQLQIVEAVIRSWRMIAADSARPAHERDMAIECLKQAICPLSATQAAAIRAAACKLAGYRDLTRLGYTRSINHEGMAEDLAGSLEAVLSVLALKSDTVEDIMAGSVDPHSTKAIATTEKRA